MRRGAAFAAAACVWAAAPAAAAPDFAPAVAADYRGHLKALFLDFHRNPELSYRETRTAGIIARELRAGSRPSPRSGSGPRR